MASPVLRACVALSWGRTRLRRGCHACLRGVWDVRAGCLRRFERCLVNLVLQIATAGGLAVWQLQRAQWKQQWLVSRAASLALPPLQLEDAVGVGAGKSAAAATLKSVRVMGRFPVSLLTLHTCHAPLPRSPLPRRHNAYGRDEDDIRRVAVRGRWLHDRTVLVSPRPLPSGATAPPGTPATGSGALVLTPLQRADGTAVLVLRGWVPTPAAAAFLHPLSPPTPDAPANGTAQRPVGAAPDAEADAVEVEGVVRSGETVRGGSGRGRGEGARV